MKRVVLRPLRLAWLVAAALGAAGTAAHSTATATAPARTPAGATSTIASFPCNDTVLLRVSDGEPKQGGVLVVEVRGELPLVSVEGFSGGEALSFWHGADARVHQALLGVDMLAHPGVFAVRARAVPESGEPVACVGELRILDGAFAVQRLDVAPRYVELSPEDLRRSRRESAELTRVFETSSRERLWRGGFVAPVEGFEASGSFGKRRVFNDQPRTPHSGEDFPAPAGTPVHATARGRVALAKGLFFLGNTVIVDHGFGLFSFYGHLSSIEVEPGTMVDSGAPVGKVGATGRVTGAHLHWGVRLGDSRVNPMALLTLAR